jgi:hypothetical protein
MQALPGKLPQPAIGSGVLTRIGGKDFVLTAGHNLEDCNEAELFLQFQYGPDLSVPVLPGAYAKSFVRPDRGEPDVAAIELDPNQSAAWRHARPITVDEFGSHESVPRGGRVLLCGFPYESVTELEPVQSPVIGGDAKPAFRIWAVPYVTAIADFDPSEDYTGGRGFFVYYGESIFEDGTVRYVAPYGISGGPVIRAEGGKCTLLGLARSLCKPHHELCEPIWCALAFLRDCHPDPAVVADAVRGLHLLGRG